MSADSFDPSAWMDVYNIACWNMGALNDLPSPEIVYNPKEMHAFYNDAKKGWKVHLNVAGIPQYLQEEYKREYLLSCAEHEILHYKVAPFDLRTYAELLDSIGKVAEELKIDKRRVKVHSPFIVNMFTDIIVDTSLKDGYGKDALVGERAIWRRSEAMRWLKGLVDQGLVGVDELSLTVKAFHKSFEHLWKKNLGVNSLGLDARDDSLGHTFAHIMGSDYHERGKWRDKMKEFAKYALLSLEEDSKKLKDRKERGEGGGGGDGFAIDGEGDSESPDYIPEDVRKEFGHLPELTEEQKSALGEHLQKLNENDKAGFGAGSAAAGFSDEETEIFWYRAKGKNLLDITDVNRAPSKREKLGYTTWKIGDNVSDLDIIRSKLIHKSLIPNVTTVKKRSELSRGTLKKKKLPPDLLLIIDSSGSMDWSDRYESAKIGAFAGLDVAQRYNIGVAAVVHDHAISRGANGEPLIKDFTNDYRAIEKIMCGKRKAAGGTELPLDELFHILKGARQPVQTIWLSDADLTKEFAYSPELDNFFRTTTSNDNRFSLLHITESEGDEVTKKIIGHGGEVKSIRKPEDIAGTVLGKIREAVVI